ncbi:MULTISPECIES: dCTP deaminase [Chryseobacterium]|uniref:Deoxycytidine triphosphate deaminase n=1 Tax=Chryseobacterium indoltheticum TaxID=254 RepID=A0A381F6D4_9FLAO|nr:MULTISPECIES: dCTP deaminase [Chryseobacterium]AZA72484.1 dCTP deaminase [Chryseobacterium indoltheticum]REC45814.1 dCTP deaminase [Chryseobacterium sp. 5_R23647]SIQ84335.1 dCTP deaminase [Chryseobacterium indoltheticum]SUX42057.1 Deoxycytidine triphosphate deaminase [Chryseobacterium indoltheticum]
MSLIVKEELKKLLENRELIITPILDEKQFGEISFDFRIGTDFLTQHQGRNAFIDTTKNNNITRSIKSSYTETRRKLGEEFLIHPSQPTLFSTLEYVKLPKNIYAVLNLRSSYSRLGLSISTIVQPGYCGCLSVEIVNSGNTSLNILTGTRFLQARFFKISENTEYFSSERKYACQVRPVSSKANEDEDLEKLIGMNI